MEICKTVDDLFGTVSGKIFVEALTELAIAFPDGASWYILQEAISAPQSANDKVLVTNT
jgi:hypothetical protein